MNTINNNTVRFLRVLLSSSSILIIACLLIVTFLASTYRRGSDGLSCWLSADSRGYSQKEIEILQSYAQRHLGIALGKGHLAVVFLVGKVVKLRLEAKIAILPVIGDTQSQVNVEV